MQGSCRLGPQYRLCCKPSSKHLEPFWPGEKDPEIITSMIMYIHSNITSLSSDKILALPKLKAFTENNSKVAQMVQFFFDKVKKQCGKRRKYWFPAFLISEGRQKLWLCGNGLKICDNTTDSVNSTYEPYSVKGRSSNVKSIEPFQPVHADMV